MSILNKYFDNIFVLYINKDEYNRIKHKIDKMNINVQYFKGINGLIDKNYCTYKENKGINNVYLTPGTYGHICSFINILQESIKLNYKKILILEPDIYFSKNFDKECIPYLNFDYKILYFGATQYKFYKEETWSYIDKNLMRNHYYYSYKTLGTFAVALDNSIFNEYLNLLKEYNKSSDVCLTILQEKYQKECIVCYPNLICCDIINSSTSPRIFKINQVNMMKKYRWTKEYDIFDIYNLNTKNGKWYELTLDINSYFNNKYYIQILDDSNKLIFPIIRQLNLLQLLLKEKPNEKSKEKSKEKLKEEINIKIYFIAKSDSTYIYLNHIFIDTYKIREINPEIIKDLIDYTIIKNNNFALGNYYLSNLYNLF